MAIGNFSRLFAGNKGEADPLQVENDRLTAENATLTARSEEYTAASGKWAESESNYLAQIAKLKGELIEANSRADSNEARANLAVAAQQAAETKAAADIAAKEAEVAARAGRQAADQMAAAGLDAGATPKTNAAAPKPATRTGPLSEAEAIRLAASHWREN